MFLKPVKPGGHVAAGRKCACRKLLFLYRFQMPGNVVQKNSVCLLLADFIPVQKVFTERKEDGFLDIQPVKKFCSSDGIAVFCLVRIEGNCLIKMYGFSFWKLAAAAIMGRK